MVKWGVHWGCGQGWAVTEYSLIAVSWYKYEVSHWINTRFLEFISTTNTNEKCHFLGHFESEMRNSHGGESGGVPHLKVAHEHNRINDIWMESRRNWIEYGHITETGWCLRPVNLN